MAQKSTSATGCQGAYMAIATQARQPQKGLTFEDVWAAILETERRFQETDKRFRKTDKQVDKMTKAVERMSERVDRVTQNVDKMSERVDRVTHNIGEMSERVDLVAKNVGGLNRSVGDLIEILIAARLWEKFTAYPYGLQRAYRRIPVYDEENHLRTDIDILLADTEWAMVVEVKREADDKDVDRHLKRMELIRKYPPPGVTGKRLLGAIAGGVVSPDAVAYAHKAGFFVLELAGESVVLLDTPAGFVAREW
jgi:hypothetical protein